MYTPRAFVDTNLAQLDALVAGDPLVTLLTVATGGPDYDLTAAKALVRWRETR